MVATLALQITPVIQKQIEVIYSIQFDYTRMNDIMMLLKQYGCTIISNEMQLFCNIKTGIPNNRLEEVLYKLKELQGVEIFKNP